MIAIIRISQEKENSVFNLKIVWVVCKGLSNQGILLGTLIYIYFNNMCIAKINVQVVEEQPTRKSLTTQLKEIFLRTFSQKEHFQEVVLLKDWILKNLKAEIPIQILIVNLMTLNISVNTNRCNNKKIKKLKTLKTPTCIKQLWDFQQSVETKVLHFWC